MPPSRRIVRTPYVMGNGTWLVIADVHVPYHDTAALEATIAYAKKQKVDGVLINGDFQDCKALGFWPSIERKNFLREVEVTLDMLDFLRGEFPKQKIVWKPGNHEDRLEMYYASNAPELVDLPFADLAVCLSLEERGIEFLGRKQPVTGGGLAIRHGHELRMAYSIVSPARSLILKAKANALCAHHHRSSDHTTSTLNRKIINTWSVGCLCDLSPDYNPEANDWNHGFGILHIDGPDSFEFLNKKILPNGKII
jgi:hypothetical protein